MYLLMKSCFKDRFLILLVSLMGLMIVSPSVQNFVRIRMLMDVFITIVFLSCIFAVSNKKSTLLTASFLALPMFFSLWLPGIAKVPFFILTGYLFGILFLTFVIVSILSFVFKQSKVSANIIYAAIVVYLLLAVLWTFFYNIIETIQPGSFAVPEQLIAETRYVISYFSFVTITTLGYGDVAPISGIARAFSTLEAVVGQIYLVVLVARLVGINIAQTMGKD